MDGASADQLNDPLGIGEVDDVSAATKAYIRDKHRKAYIVSIIICIFLMGSLLWLLYQAEAAFGSNFDRRNFLLVFAPLLIPLHVYLRYKRQVQGEFLEQMAQTIGYTYSASAPLESTAGAAFSSGRSDSLENVMTGTYRNYPARFFDFSYPQGKTMGTRMVFELTYPSPLPRVLVNLMLVGSSEPDDVEQVRLEGNFNSYFRLYAGKGAQMEIREIFQPDTMQDFIAQFQDCCMEINGAKIYLIGRNAMTGNKQEFLSMQQFMDSIFDKLLPSLAGVSTDTAAANAVAAESLST